MGAKKLTLNLRPNNCMPLGNLDMIVLNLPKPLLDFRPTPSRISYHLRPLIKIITGANNPAGEVDRRGSPEPLSPRIINLLAFEMLLGDGVVAPV
jgi:hypothetical protein